MKTSDITMERQAHKIEQLQAELNKHILNNLVSIDRIHGGQDTIRNLQAELDNAKSTIKDLLPLTRKRCSCDKHVIDGLDEICVWCENKRLKEVLDSNVWLLTTLRDVLTYNDYSKIDLALIESLLNQYEDCDPFTKREYGEIHKRILEAGLATLPTTDKAIKALEREVK